MDVMFLFRNVTLKKVKTINKRPLSGVVLWLLLIVGLTGQVSAAQITT